MVAIRRLVLGISGAITLIAFGWLAREYLEVRKYAIVANPEAFTKDFEPSGETSIRLERQCKFWAFSCEGQEYIGSPLWPPFRGLETVAVESYDCLHSYRNRYIHRDPLWQVFWIEITHCPESGEPFGKVFGPYRYRPSSSTQ